MTFLQPFILWGLPLVLLPVIIHLINRMRHRPWPMPHAVDQVNDHRQQYKGQSPEDERLEKSHASAFAAPGAFG